MRSWWAPLSVLSTAGLGSTFWWQKKADPYELKLVQVLFRHGARTPLKSIPDVLEAQWVPDLLEVPNHTNIDYVVTDLQGGPRPNALVEDNYRSKKLYYMIPYEFLHSLNYFTVHLLRKKYIYTTAHNCLSVCSIRSTNIIRTIESAKCLVAGLYQQKQTDVVSILTEEAEREILYPNYHGCKQLKLYRWAESSTLPDIASDLQSIQSALGVQPEQHLDFILIRDDMVARETHGLPCPAVLHSWRARVEQRAVDMIYHIYDPANRVNLQLCVGPLLHTFLNNMEMNVQNNALIKDRKLFLYSAHDTTLMPCLMALGVFDMRWPPYAADITLELYQHRKTNQHYIKVSYVGQVRALIHTLILIYNIKSINIL
uniref:Acid phosphatase 6, lysophosphatidic n=1 Tax=Astyanax mexicanus TaxID=7994 RepID=A0A8B9GTR8_ASTMX